MAVRPLCTVQLSDIVTHTHSSRTIRRYIKLKFKKLTVLDSILITVGVDGQKDRNKNNNIDRYSS